MVKSPFRKSQHIFLKVLPAMHPPPKKQGHLPAPRLPRCGSPTARPTRKTIKNNYFTYMFRRRLVLNRPIDFCVTQL